MFEIRKYNDADKEVWNTYVEHARNATFLLNRSYMDYHSDRFHDHSLMIFHNNKLYALLPANEDGDVFYSHQGLTYAGLLTTGHASAEISVRFRCHQHIPEAGRFPEVHLQTDTLDLPATASRRRPLCSLQGMPGANLRQKHCGCHRPEASAEMV